MISSKASAAWTVEVIPYHRASILLQQEFAALQRRAYQVPRLTKTSKGAPRLHHPVFDVLSFYICAGDRVVSYAAVAMKQIRHARHTFDMAGLSCVMTDPDYQKRGLGSRTIAAATRYLERSNLDIGIFTCDPPLVHFYERAGAWQVAPDIALVGSRDEAALRSDRLNKVVLLRLFSKKAARLVTRFNATVNLDVPVGQFL